MRRRFARSVPAIDGPKARASAQMFLVGARSLDNVTTASLASSYRLSPKVAEYLLAVAKQRRER